MRMFCEHCGAELEASVPVGGTVRVRCPVCRAERVVTGGLAANPVAKTVSTVAGLEEPKGFSFRQFFSEVFSRHTEEEQDAFWSAGTSGNVPPIGRVPTEWPRPWMFARLLAVTAIAYGLLYFGLVRFENPNMIPGLILVGSFAVPIALVVGFFEIDVARNVSFPAVFKAFFLGGILSLVLSLFMFQVSSFIGLDRLGDSVAGIAEEVGKLLAVILFVRTARYPYVLNGLLFGAAVGAGFAAFESAGYALTTLIGKQSVSSMINTIVVRAWLTGLCGHILWTGMSAGALWLVKGDRKFEWRMLADFRFLRVFLIAVAAHMVWNCDWNPRLISIWDKECVLGALCWFVIFCLIQSGLNQLRRAKDSARVTYATKPVFIPAPAPARAAASGPIPVIDAVRVSGSTSFPMGR